MIQIEMSKDINDFSPKIISIFDKRQLVCVGLASAYGLPIVVNLTSVDIYTRLTIAIVLMFPVLMCGWVRLYGMYLEKFAWHIFRTRVIGKTNKAVPIKAGGGKASEEKEKGKEKIQGRHGSL